MNNMKRVILRKQMIIVSSIFMLSFFCYSCCCLLPAPPSINVKSRGPIDDETLSFIQVGMTTKEDVLLKLGNPTFCSKNDDSLEYCWPRFYGGLMYSIHFPYGGHSGNVSGVTGMGKTHCISVEFDDHCILKKYEVKTNVELQTEIDGTLIPQCHSTDKQPDVAK
ncbi:MAG: hypothetical protein ACLP9S_08380 [Syntrophales bacterium]|jgi:hypothetical protein